MERMSGNSSLGGLRVLVCRPREQAAPLCRALEQAGALPRALPTIEIRPLPLPPEQQALIQDLDLYQTVVVVSVNAASLVAETAAEWWPQWPVGIRWLAVGARTGAVLAEAGLDCHCPEQGMTSEDLLALPELAAIEGQRILLCKGQGGREVLAETLRKRGARVDELILYERVLPCYGEDAIQAALTDFDPRVIVALSGETLNNLLALGQNTDHNLRRRTVLVPGERVAAQAKAAGFSRILTPADLTPAGIIDALATWLSESGTRTH